MLNRVLSVSVAAAMAAAVAMVPQASGQDLSLFNAHNTAAVNLGQTIALNSAITQSANISAGNRGTRSPQTSGNNRSSEASEWLSANPSSSTVYEAIPYSTDTKIRAEIIEIYVNRVRQSDEQGAELLAQLFSGSLTDDPSDRDLIGEFAQNAQLYGLDINDLGDVITAYWAVNWGAVNQTGRPSVEQVQGLRSQIRAALAGHSLNESTTLADRQRIADDMMVNLILIDGGVEEALRDGNVQQLQELSTVARETNLESMGIDLAALTLTDRGLTLR